jgi:hypothetical protein
MYVLGGPRSSGGKRAGLPGALQRKEVLLELRAGASAPAAVTGRPVFG